MPIFLRMCFFVLEAVCEELEISSTGFQWGDSFPIFGKYIAKTAFGKKSSAYLSSKIGSMWVVSLVKK